MSAVRRLRARPEQRLHVARPQKPLAALSAARDRKQPCMLGQDRFLIPYKPRRCHDWSGTFPWDILAPGDATWGRHDLARAANAVERMVADGRPADAGGAR